MDQGARMQGTMMAIDLKEYWERGTSFDRWLEDVEANRELWRALYRRATAPEDGAESLLGRGPYRLLVLAEDWCGDAVNTLPWLARLVEATDALELRVLRRDENPELMAAHTTNGAHSIPVVMVLDRDYRKLGWWGPRPTELQSWVMEEGLELPKDERYKYVRTWYARDRGATTRSELLTLLAAADATEEVEIEGIGAGS